MAIWFKAIWKEIIISIASKEISPKPHFNRIVSIKNGFCSNRISGKTQVNKMLSVKCTLSKKQESNILKMNEKNCTYL